LEARLRSGTIDFEDDQVASAPLEPRFPGGAAVSTWQWMGKRETKARCYL
jgi:hypothetical protein